MRKMTVRQRVAAALRHEPVDQVPFTAYRGIASLGREQEDRLRALGLGYFVRAPLVETERPNVVSEDHQYQEHGVAYRRNTIRTPVGEICKTWRVATAYGSDWAVDHYVKSADDYRTAEFMIKDTIYRPAYQAYRQTVEEVGEAGYVSGNMGYSPLMEMRVNLLGVERFAFDMYDRPDLFFSLYQTLREKERQAYPLLANSPADLVIYCGNQSPEIIGRERFAQYCAPCYNELGEMLHARGKLLGSHMDANNAEWKDVIASSALDVIEAFTPAPDTDMSVAEARAAWPKKALWINFPSSLHLAPPARIREYAHNLVRETAGGIGLIVGITENVPDEVGASSLTAIAEALAQSRS